MTYESAATRRIKHFRRVGVVLLAVGLMVAYFFYLSAKNGRAEVYLEDLRASSPARYLEEIRSLHGFDRFLDAFRDIRGHTEFSASAPPFIVGRWTMKDEQVRMLPNTSSALCTRPLVIDYGRITIGSEDEVADEAAYRLSDGGGLDVETERFGRVSIRIVAYGAQINYLEFVPPGESEPVYAYRCTT